MCKSIVHKWVVWYNVVYATSMIYQDEYKPFNSYKEDEYESFHSYNHKTIFWFACN